MTTKKLSVSNEQKDIDLYLNDKGQMFIEEITERDENPYTSWFTIDPEDWPLIKQFIDEQFNLQP